MNQAFPGPNVPLLDARGFLTPVWVNFFAALWQRTGQGPGGSFRELKQQIEAVTTGGADNPLAWMLDDDPALSLIQGLNARLASLADELSGASSMALAMADTSEPAPASDPLTVLAMLDPPEPVTDQDPMLNAMLISDI